MLLSWTLPMERILDSWLASEGADRKDFVTPAADVTDDGEVFRIVMDMPGVTRDGLEIELENDILKVRGKRAPTQSEHLVVDGRGADRPFERRFTLGKDVDRSNIKARHENGVVTITLPRRADVKPHRIEVEVG